MSVFECCLLLFILGRPVASQDCREYSQSCSDDKSCCGGCCMDGICKYTYSDCRVKSDPCLEAVCPPAQECYIYFPIDCPGCGPSKQCRDAPPSPDILETTSSSINMRVPNESSRLSSSNHMFSVLLLVSYNFCRYSI